MRTTQEYFNLTPEELSIQRGYGYTREECLLCDHNVHAQPFCTNYEHALRKAADYEALGCEEIEILKMLSGKYAIVCY